MTHPQTVIESTVREGLTYRIPVYYVGPPAKAGRTNAAPDPKPLTHAQFIAGMPMPTIPRGGIRYGDKVTVQPPIPAAEVTESVVSRGGCTVRIRKERVDYSGRPWRLFTAEAPKDDWSLLPDLPNLHDANYLFDSWATREEAELAADRWITAAQAWRAAMHDAVGAYLKAVTAEGVVITVEQRQERQAATIDGSKIRTTSVHTMSIADHAVLMNSMDQFGIKPDTPT